MTPAPAAAPTTAAPDRPARPRRRWLLVLILLGALGLLLLGGIAVIALAMQWLPLHIVVNGEPIDGSLIIEGLSATDRDALGAVAALAVLAVLFVVPMLLLLALGVLFLGLLFSFGIPLLALAGVGLLLASPVLLIVWLRRRARRASTPNPPPPAGSGSLP